MEETIKIQRTETEENRKQRYCDYERAKQYLEMVRAVNHNPYAVNESEHLTDNAYHYDAKTKQLETAEEYEARLEKERTEKRRSHYSRKKEKQQEREEPEEEEELER